MISYFAKSLSITAVISLLFGVVFFLTGNDFWLPIGVAFLSQIVIWFIVQYIADIYVKVKAAQIETERIRELERMGAEVECAFCGEVAFVPIDLSADSTYTCDKCYKENAILITIKTAQTTQPLTKSDSDVLATIKQDNG